MPQVALRRGGRIGRTIALALLALALVSGLWLGAPGMYAAPVSATSCGSTLSGCGPLACHAITAADLSQPDIAPLGGARAQLNRASGLPVSTVGISGSGWPSGATVDVLLATYGGAAMWVDPTVIAQGAADASGNIHIADFMPPRVEGCMTADLSANAPDPVLFVIQVVGKARVSLEYTIYPSPQFWPLQQQTMASGSLVALTGSGWAPGQVISIVPAIEPWPVNGYPSNEQSAFTPLPGLAKPATAQADGSVSVTIQTPVEPAETQVTFLASATDTQFGAFTIQSDRNLSVLPTTSATLALSATGGLAGSTVRITGSNWPANQAIQISYCRDEYLDGCDPGKSEALAIVHADGEGRLNALATIPVDARPGAITIQVNPTATPFDFSTYARALPYTILFPFSQAHPRLTLAIHASPFIAAGLIIALLFLAEWLRDRRRAGCGVR